MTIGNASQPVSVTAGPMRTFLSAMTLRRIASAAMQVSCMTMQRLSCAPRATRTPGNRMQSVTVPSMKHDRLYRKVLGPLLKLFAPLM